MPTFAARDIITAAQLNDWMTEITALFNAYISTDNLKWPFKAGGHIDMRGYAVSGVPIRGSVYNLVERPTWASTQRIFDEIEARGGGTALLPGNSTQASTSDINGIPNLRPGSNTALVGHGHSSVLGAVYASNKRNLTVRDLQLNGANQFLDCDNIVFERCNFTGTGAYQLRLKGCSNVALLDCRFDGAATLALLAEGFDNLIVEGCDFEDSADYFAKFLASSGGTFANLRLHYNIFRNASYTPGDRIGLYIGYTNAQNGAVRSGVRLSVRGNMLRSGPTSIYAVNADDLDITGNMLLDASTPLYSLWAKVFTDIKVRGNLMRSSDAGMVFGSGGGAPDHEGRSIIVVTGNYVLSPDEAVVWRSTMWGGSRGSPWASPATSMPGVFVASGNYFEGQDATLPAGAIWDLKIDNTYHIIRSMWIGNNFSPGASVRGFRCFTDAGTAGGGIIGGSAAADQWFMFCANTAPGLVVGTSAGNDMTDDATDKVIVQNNNA